MRKSIQKVLSFALAGAMVLQPLPSAQSVFKVNAGVASESKFDIPQADASGRVGAKVPYTRYDSLQANIGGGAQIASSKNFDRMNIASQACTSRRARAATRKRRSSRGRMRGRREVRFTGLQCGTTDITACIWRERFWSLGATCGSMRTGLRSQRRAQRSFTDVRLS